MRTGSTGGSNSGSCASVPPSSCPRVNHRDAPTPGPGATAPGDLAPVPGAPASSSSLSPFTKPRAPVARQRITPPPSLPRRTGSASSKRKWSDPLSGSAEFWDGFKNVYGEISSSKKQNIMDAAIQKKADDDAEYEAFMRDLISGGVNPLSPEYMMASEVLLDVSCRGAYRPLPSIEAKLAWIKNMYLMMKGQPPFV